MGAGECTGRSSPSLKSASRPIRAAFVLWACATMFVLGGDSPSRLDETSSNVQLVASSGGERPRALASSQRSWQADLATERTCPGGNRTDLSSAHERATLACLVNWARRRHGLPGLTVVSLLNRVSLGKAHEIVRCRNFGHSPCGQDWRANLLEVGYRGAAGENLYLGGGKLGAPRVAVEGWLRSPSHRANLFAPDWRTQGLARVTLALFGAYRDVTLWVNVFGDR